MRLSALLWNQDWLHSTINLPPAQAESRTNVPDSACAVFGHFYKFPSRRDPLLQVSVQTAKVNILHLPQVQRAILDNAARYVKPGGVLVYSTCTLLRRENEAVALGFLADHPHFEAEGFPLPECVGDARTGMLTLWPHRQGTDGFFICKLRKEG